MRCVVLHCIGSKVQTGITYNVDVSVDTMYAPPHIYYTYIQSFVIYTIPNYYSIWNIYSCIYCSATLNVIIITQAIIKRGA